MRCWSWIKQAPVAKRSTFINHWSRWCLRYVQSQYILDWLNKVDTNTDFLIEPQLLHERRCSFDVCYDFSTGQVNIEFSKGREVQKLEVNL